MDSNLLLPLMASRLGPWSPSLQGELCTPPDESSSHLGVTCLSSVLDPEPSVSSLLQGWPFYTSPAPAPPPAPRGTGGAVSGCLPCALSLGLSEIPEATLTIDITDLSLHPLYCSEVGRLPCGSQPPHILASPRARSESVPGAEFKQVQEAEGHSVWSPTIF